MILTTTPTVEGRPAVRYLGIVVGEAIVGANIVKDLFANIRVASRRFSNSQAASFNDVGFRCASTDKP